MHILLGRRCIALLVAASALLLVTRGNAQQPLLVTANGAVDNWVDWGDSLRLVNWQPSQPVESPIASPFVQPIESPGVDSSAPAFTLAQAIREAATQQTGVGNSAIGAGETRTNPTTDLGSALQTSDNVQTLNAQRRSPISFDPHIRGYRFGEIYSQASGEYWLPARLDLDSMLSKIDPYLIRTATVIPGPYGLQYGPGFSFIDVVTLNTPRCTGWNNRFSIIGRGNGSQILGNDTVQYGGANYGFISSYGLRTGSDYRAGNGQLIPSSFHNQNVLMQYGFDTANGNVEFRYNRFDMWKTEYALAFFDINSMQTDSYNLSYNGVDPSTDATNLAQVWYNQTAFNGNNLAASKLELRTRIAGGLNNDFRNAFPGSGTAAPFTASDIAGFVNGNLVSSGARAVRTYGDVADEYFRMGTDVRYITQSTSERFLINDPTGLNFLPADSREFFTAQPHSALTDPGMFTEYGVPWLGFLKSAIGGRVDFVNTHATNVGSKNDVLLASYFTTDMELTPEWTARGGVGYAERVPDLVNRYSNGVFLAIMQNGFSKVRGVPDLKKERATQIDGSLLADYGTMTGRATAFYSWINDYNTYSSLGVEQPPAPLGAQILVATNTPLATLGGFELYGDYRTSDITTYFASMQYVQGTDRGIDKPLPQIYPLQGRLGVRWADPSPISNYGLEWGFRMVAAQNRAGFVHDQPTPFEQTTAGFYTSYLRGYWNLSQNVHLTGGVDNMFNRNYLEHLDIRLRGAAQSPGGVTAALAPGFTAYAGLEWLL